jgi:hypothetical protein
MQKQQREHFNDLCGQAAKETDPNKLTSLIAEIVTLLRTRQRELADAEAKNE